MAVRVRRNLGNRGQMTTEMVLILVVLVGAAIAVSSAFRNNEYFASLVSGPWRALAGLIQNGTYGSPSETMAQHPSQFERASSVKGEPLQ